MRGFTKAAAVIATMAAMSVPFSAQAGDAAAGAAKAAMCAGCHGANGKAVIPNYPNLAGQNEAYLIHALHAYKNKERNGGTAVIMQGQAAMLSDTDIENLAAHFSSLK